MFRRSLFLFRRDLRLDDNTALIEAVNNSHEVVPLFILDPRQVHPHPYHSLNSQQFLFNSLQELHTEISRSGSCLNLLYGVAEEVLEELFSNNSTHSFEALFLNRDYTPFSTKRDEALLSVCNKYSVKLVAAHDTLLTEPLKSVKADGKPYTVFTPFFKKNVQTPPPKPIAFKQKNFSPYVITGTKPITFLKELLPSVNERLYMQGGRKEGMHLVEKISSLKEYNTNRNLPAVNGTSGLSAHHKFGTVSIRETYWRAKDTLDDGNSFISELYWRDFFTAIGYFFPHVFGQAFHKRYNDLEWNDPKDHFQNWQNGTTGFPIVDAGMRQLNTTGWMHNRVRMITASFLVKDLHIDWRLGEQYFAQKLVDYDPAVNNGSWQWAASTGCDAQPYFRIFNPKLQQEKFDPSADYIKEWVPELKNFTAKQIHNFESMPLGQYQRPIITHATEKKETERRYAEVNEK